jgi:hypothetical protein
LYKFTKVTCSGEKIDLKNDVWTVIGASGKSVNEGNPVSDNNIVGFKHQATGCNLHSHNTNHGKVTPISKQQQGIVELIYCIECLSFVFKFIHFRIIDI